MTKAARAGHWRTSKKAIIQARQNAVVIVQVRQAAVVIVQAHQTAVVIVPDQLHNTGIMIETRIDTSVTGKETAECSPQSTFCT